MRNYKVTPSFSEEERQKIVVLCSSKCGTYTCTYLRSEVLELVNYDHRQSFNGTRCLPLLRITSQQTIILNDLNIKV
jgi:hypothetical protein